MSEFNGMSNEDLRKGILEQQRRGTGSVSQTTDPKDLAAAKRDENLRAEFFLRAHPDAIDSETRAAALRQINSVLRELRL
jgi:hypothetical protein